MKKMFSKMNYLKLLLIGIFSLLLISSCTKDSTTSIINTPPVSTKEIVSPSGFKFATASDVNFNVEVLNHLGQPVPNIKINVLSSNLEDSLFSVVTDEFGSFNDLVRISTQYDSITILANVIGINNTIKCSVSNNINVQFGGISSSQKSSIVNWKGSNNIYPLGTFNTLGVPSYLTSNDPISDNDFLLDINQTFPEYLSLVNSRPEYFLSNLEHDIKFIQSGDLWITFLHEGASYTNTLGYYTYPLNNPPLSEDDIDTIKVVFPNVSFNGSGGGLVCGNRVFLGTIPANTGIGWVLLSDSFKNGNIGNGKGNYYSNPNFNPEPQNSEKKHSIILNDNNRQRLILSFEDQRRNGSCDNDFNDAIFSISVEPYNSINTQNYPSSPYTQPDSDGDGILDINDDYPNDPERAFNNYYPSNNTYGSLVFEDLWPAQGDYDFNDMVISYRINQVTNANNFVVDIKSTLILKAIGASYSNGFGINFPFSSNIVSSVTGTKLTDGLITLNPNGTEANQENTTVIVFDNAFKLLKHPGNGIVGINTVKNSPYVTPDTTNITITLSTPIELQEIGLPPYNPFIFVNKNRSHEIHLPLSKPTDLADLTLFNTLQDASNIGLNRFYVTKNNLGWALDIAGEFQYPIEKSDISSAYLKFVPWAQSDGIIHQNWWFTDQNFNYIY